MEQYHSSFEEEKIDFSIKPTIFTTDRDVSILAIVPDLCRDAQD